MDTDHDLNVKSHIMKQLSHLLLVLCATSPLMAQSTATYTVTFESNWSNQTHPHPQGMFPANAHWSRLVGATHKDENVFLEMGGLATQGVENIAEQGTNGVFQDEVEAAIDAGWANQYIFGGNLGSALGQIVIQNLEVSSEYSYLTLLSMIAPSPDWMIAISSVPLQDEEGEWRELIEIDLYPYDAGTDSGIDYNSANNNTNPQEPITNVQGVTPFSNEKVGTMTIELQEVLGITDRDFSLAVGPNPFNSAFSIQAVEPLKTISVYNSLGVLVSQHTAVNDTQVLLQTANWTSGLYLVAAEFESGETRVIKAIKN